MVNALNGEASFPRGSRRLALASRGLLQSADAARVITRWRLLRLVNPRMREPVRRSAIHNPLQ
ncbi:hypothetical protein BURKHO8Y_140174 [Burkholderia sp. 8Y]|nr:hypothetical protein BURKHO8Y_140174 [Burkholderia sp. 8Y]